jgi:hypothetical protein
MRSTGPTGLPSPACTLDIRCYRDRNIHRPLNRNEFCIRDTPTMLERKASRVISPWPHTQLLNIVPDLQVRNLLSYIPLQG